MFWLAEMFSLAQLSKALAIPCRPFGSRKARKQRLSVKQRVAGKGPVA